MSIEIAKSMLDELAAKFEAGDIEGGKSDLTKMKLEMLNFPLTEEHNDICISALEFGVLFSVEDHDLQIFARNLAQLKPHYSLSTSKSSDRKCHILGLNLMYLLVDNNLSEFHANLELLLDDEATTPYLSFPITLERHLMVGLYDEVLSARSCIPHPSYGFFMDNLLQTVRDSIADCIEVSYKSIKIQVAMGMMKFESRKIFMEYIGEHREDWQVTGDYLCFQPADICLKASDIPSTQLIAQTLSYATELVRIV